MHKPIEDHQYTPSEDLPKPSKPQKPIHQLLDLLCDATPFLSEHGQAYVILYLDGDRQHVLPIRSPAFRSWIVEQNQTIYRRPPSESSLRYAIQTFESRALRSGFSYPLHRRVAAHRLERQDDRPAISLDLSNRPGHVVEITTDGWKITDRSEALFLRSNSLLPIPAPIPANAAEALSHLRSLLNLSTDRDWLRSLAWLLGAFRPTGPYPILALHGPTGSGKSTTARLLRTLIDPCRAPLSPAPATPRELLQSARQSQVLVFDHVGKLAPSVSNALCQLSTGTGFSYRESYQRGDATQMNIARPILLTLTSKLLDADLENYTLRVELKPITPEQRRTETEIDKKFEQARPAFLSALCLAVSTALGQFAETKLPLAPRFADCAAWAVAATPALGVTAEAMLEALLPDDDPIPSDDNRAATVRQRLSNGPWTGSATDLLTELQSKEAAIAWPATPKGLSQLLNKSTGLSIVRSRTGKSRQISIRATTPTNVSEISKMCHNQAATGINRCSRDPDPWSANLNRSSTINGSAVSDQTTSASYPKLKKEESYMVQHAKSWYTVLDSPT